MISFFYSFCKFNSVIIIQNKYYGIFFITKYEDKKIPMTAVTGTFELFTATLPLFSAPGRTV